MLRRGLGTGLARRMFLRSSGFHRFLENPLSQFAVQAEATALACNQSGLMFYLSLAWRKVYLSAARRSFSEDSSTSPFFLPTFLATVAATLAGSIANADCGRKEDRTSEQKVRAVLENLEIDETKKRFGPGNTMYIPPDKLRLVRKLNEGTFGQIWLGELHDGSHIEEVAVKLLSEEFVAQECLAEILKVEAQIFHLVSTRCHHVCRLYGIACMDDQVCLVMKLYKKSLGDVLQENRGHLSMSDLQKYGLQVCQGLVELHDQGVIMQDLKPSNILIDDVGHAVLADFGMASFVEREKGASVVTAAKGTPSYMAPEAWDPKSMGGMSTKTDMWSLACVIIELYSGVPPWCGLEVEEISGNVKDRMNVPRLPRGLPPVLADAVRRCLSFDPQDRPQAREMLAVFMDAWEASEEYEEGVTGYVPMTQGSYCVPGTLPNPLPSIQGSYWVAEAPQKRVPMMQGSYYIPGTDERAPLMIQGSLYVPNDMASKRASSSKQVNQRNKELCGAVARYAQVVEVV